MIRSVALACVLALAAAAGAAAQGGDVDRAFAAAVVAAINAPTVEARAALVHPAARPCITGEVGEWWRDSVLRQGRPPLPADYRWKVTPLAADEARAASDRFEWPLTPTHVLQIDAQDAPTKSRALLIRLARNGERWAEVVPCAKPATGLRALRALRRRGARGADLDDLATSIPPALRDRVVALYKDGHRIDAYQAYAKESGEEPALAREVVDLLVEGPR